MVTKVIECVSKHRSDEEKSITPTFMYKMQGKSDQLDVGLYGQYNQLLGSGIEVFRLNYIREKKQITMHWYF
jgi:hypothetical protein